MAHNVADHPTKDMLQVACCPECGNSDEWYLLKDGNIQCLGCGGLQHAVWAHVDMSQEH